jgi:hypothetical protein
MHDGTASTAHAGRPFRLTGCIELRGILSRRAGDEGELAGREYLRRSFLITRQLRASPSILMLLTA